MPNHMLLMSFNDDFYQLNYTLDCFFGYTLTLVQQKYINFCYIGTASNDNAQEDFFFLNFIRTKFYKYVSLSKLSLTTELSAEAIEKHIRQQDVIFFGGGDTELMLRVWKEKNFDAILNKLKKEDKLPIIAGLSAGAMFPFESTISLTYSLPKEYKVLSGYHWIPGSFCVHSNSKEEAICTFDQNKKHARMSAYETAIRTGALSPGYAISDNCMLHFYGDKLQHALSTSENASCVKVEANNMTPIAMIYLDRSNASMYAQETLKELHELKEPAEEVIYPPRCSMM